MIAAGSDVHWVGILTVCGMGLGMITGTLWRLGTAVGRVREEAETRQGELAGLVADWCDEVDDHLERQDAAITSQAYRLQAVERASGVVAQEPYVPVRPRRVPRRLDAIRQGLKVPQRITQGPEDALGETDGKGSG